MVAMVTENFFSPADPNETEPLNCISGSVQIQEWKSPLRKLRDERVNNFMVFALQLPRLTKQ